MDELLTAGRKRTLLLMLEALYRFETHGAVHGGEPPSPDYFGRPGVGGAYDDEVEAREVVVIHDNYDDANGAPESAAAKLLATQVATLTAQLADANAAAEAAHAAAVAAQVAAERVVAEKAALKAAAANADALHKQTAAKVATLTTQLDAANYSVRVFAAETQTLAERVSAEKAALEAAIAGRAGVADLHRQAVASLSAKQQDNEALSAKLEAAEAREARLRAQLEAAEACKARQKAQLEAAEAWEAHIKAHFVKMKEVFSEAEAAVLETGVQADDTVVFEPAAKRNRAEL